MAFPGTLRVLVCIAGVASLAPGFAAARGGVTVRRVCVQMGVPTYAAPRRTARITRGTIAVPTRLDGGTYVQVTDATSDGYQEVRSLKGGTFWIPITGPQAGRPSLCLAQASTLRVCADAAANDIPVEADFEDTSAPPVMFLKRPSTVQGWGYFEDHGRWTFVEREGRVGFVRSQDLCLDQPMPKVSDATMHFRMTVAAADPQCYQSQRTRAASEIRRIVIHNSENTLRSAIATFQSCNPDHPASAHVAIDRDGGLYRLVEDRFAAFHTGGSDGGFNAASLGIEIIAADRPGQLLLTAAQERSLVSLLRFWMAQYTLAIPDRILANSSRTRGYNDVEFWEAPVTLHRLVSAGRGTDCPKFIWPDTPAGDDEFFTWRRGRLGDMNAAR
jgi:N-acetylmuramoyl-L-alanine amidase-like protein